MISTILPLDKLPVSHKYVRIMQSTGISDVLAEGLRGNNTPVAFVVDEIAQAGPLRILADCWGMAAGAAQLQMVGVYQNAGQVMNQFKTAWQTMLANSNEPVFWRSGPRNGGPGIEDVRRYRGVEPVEKRQHRHTHG